MAKSRKVEKQDKEKEVVIIPTSLYSNKYKPLPKFKGCTNC